MELKIWSSISNHGKNEKNINEILCEDTLLIVFRKFSLREIYPIRRVCRYWNQLITENILKFHKDLSICMVPYSTNKYFAREYVPQCYQVKNLEQLSLIPIYHQNTEIFKVFNFVLGEWFHQDLLVHLKKLKSISILDCTFQIDMAILFNDLKNITHLELMDLGITDDVIKTISENLIKLEYLNVSGNRRLTGQWLGLLPSTLNNLSMESCRNLTMKNLYEALESLLKKGGELKVLDIKNCYFEADREPYMNFAQYLKNLREIELSRAHFLYNCPDDLFMKAEKIVFFQNDDHDDDEPSQFLAKFFKVPLVNLKHLNLITRDERITEELLVNCLNACPNLEQLKLMNFHHLDISCFKVITQLKLLTALSTDSIKIDNGTAMEIIKNCTQLKNFNISQILIPFICYGLSERFFIECFEFFEAHPERKLNLVISQAALPRHNIYKKIPENLTLSILRS